MRKPCLYAAGALAAVVAFGFGFKAITGDCPLRCLMRHVHGDSQTQAAPTKPTAS